MESRPKVVWIVGMAYSGSSLLNLLLDTQPSIRGLGEGAQVWRKYETGGPCAVCKRRAARCELYKDYSSDVPFYRFNFENYPESNVLIDSSKHARWFVQKPFEGKYDHYCLLLSKTPHEEAYSLLKHNQWDYWARKKRDTTVAVCFARYVHTYQKYFEALDEFRPLGPGRILAVHYRQMAERPAETIRRICDWLDVPYSETRLQSDDWRRTDTHILGGNPALIAQVSQDENLAFKIPSREYLDGKYANVDGKIFVDDHWRNDARFLEQVTLTYETYDSSLGELLRRLGHPPIEHLLHEVRSTPATSRRSADKQIVGQAKSQR